MFSWVQYSFMEILILGWTILFYSKRSFLAFRFYQINKLQQYTENDLLHIHNTGFFLWHLLTMVHYNCDPTRSDSIYHFSLLNDILKYKDIIVIKCELFKPVNNFNLFTLIYNYNAIWLPFICYDVYTQYIVTVRFVKKIK